MRVLAQGVIAMLSDARITERGAALLVAQWLPDTLILRRGGQFEALLTDLAKLCVAETLRMAEGQYELGSRLSAAYDVLYALQNFGFPNALEKHRWEDAKKIPDPVRKQLESAMASVWKRRDPMRSMKEGFESDQYFAGTPGELHADLSAYMESRWLRHPSVDWIFLDMMVTRELSAFGEELKKQCFPGKKDSMGTHDKYWTARGNVSKMAEPSGLARLIGPSREFSDPNSPFSKSVAFFELMYATWRCLTGPVINPVVLRDEMLKSKNEGAAWDGPSWALIERVIEFDRAVWIVGPYSR